MGWAGVPAVPEALVAKENPALRQREILARSAGQAQGEAKGWAEALLRVLEARSIAVSSAQREEILGCRDLAQLDRWLGQVE